MNTEYLHRQAESYERQADVLRERARRLEENLLRFPQQEDDVIFFRKMFANGVTYTYAAVAFELNGRIEWATTAPKSPKYYTTEQLIEWMYADYGIEELWVATEWTRV